MLFNNVAAVYLNKMDELASSTVRTYYWNLRMVKKFNPNLDCSDLSENVVKDFRRYLVAAGNKSATVTKALTVFRIFCKKMLADGLIESDPFKNIKIGRVYVRRGFLTIRELKKLYLDFDSKRDVLTPTEQECVRVFLFSCFTGLRYSDLKTLTFDEIYDWKIRKQTQKTGEAVYIPIPVQARLLLPTREENSQAPVFHVVENSTFNKRLRRAAKKLGFAKYLHCHLARHTFATTCISIGIPLPATSKLLGHRNLDTTLIYAKYVDTYLDKEMAKFNQLK